jgi:heme oxygenase
MSILREYTNAKHRAVEEHPFVQMMMNGELNKEQHAMFLQQMYYVYRDIEYYGELVGLFHNMRSIKRTDAIKEDIIELGYRVLNSDELFPSTKSYREHIMKLYYDKRGDQILAHVYVRHMGDLYGGKLIARKVPGSGKAYQFDDRPALIKALDAKLTMDILDEALLAFDMSENMFKDMLKKVNETK